MYVNAEALTSCDDPEWEHACEVCCKGSPAACSDDELHCPIHPNHNFTILYIIGTILLLFVAGLPLTLIFLDILIIWRPCGVKKSICECLLYVLCYVCLFRKESINRNRRKMESQQVI